MSVSGDPDEYMGDDGDDLPLEGSSQFAMGLDKGAEWLHNLTNAEIADLHAYDKGDIAQSLARLVSMAEAAGVLSWHDEELDNKLQEVALGYFPNPSALAPGDVTMQEALPGPPPGGFRVTGLHPLGGHGPSPAPLLGEGEADLLQPLRALPR